MNDFDWDLYDPVSTQTEPKKPEKKTHHKQKSSSEFDWDLYDPEHQKEKEFSFGSYAKSAAKGLVEGVSALGRVMGPLKERRAGEFSPEKQTEALNELLPTEDTFGESAIRRGLKLAPTAIAQPFGGVAQSAIRSVAAGGLGETAKELGFGELGQSLFELGGYITPATTKKLFEKGKFKELINAGKRFGMSDEEIAPLIQSNFKQKWFSKVAKKTGKTEERLQGTKNALGRSYEALNQSENATKVLTPKNQNTLLKDLTNIAEKLPSEVRNRIAQDMQDLVKGPITGQSLINLWKDINYYLGRGEKQLGVFKEPIRKAIGSLSPELEEDFSMINQMYSRFYPITKGMKPGDVDKFVNYAETLGLIGGVATWNLPLIATIAGENTARQLASEMLTNPRYQQLSIKLAKAIKDNSPIIIKETSNQIQTLIDESLHKKNFNAFPNKKTHRKNS